MQRDLGRTAVGYQVSRLFDGGAGILRETARIGRRRKEGSRRTRFREARRLQPLHDRLLDQGQGTVRCHMMCALLLCEQSLRADLGCPSMSRSG
jgi:hypothetical protein